MEGAEVTPARIIQIATGGWATAVLATAVRYSIFTHVERGADNRDAIARRAGISERGAAAILDGLVAMGFLTVSNGRYRNAADAAEFLVEGKASYFGGYPNLMFSTYSDWLDLPEVVREGHPLGDLTSEVPESPFWEELVPAIMVLSVPLVLAAAKRLKIQESGEISILDVGGGSGVYSAFWLEMNPRARSTQIDWANVNRIAARIVGRRGVADRFRTVDGDFHAVDFGTSEYDVGVYSHIAHMESPASNRATLRKFRKALKPGGTLLVSDFVVENDRSGPAFPLLFGSEMLVRTREGFTWRRADYESWLREAGFRTVEFQTTPSPATLVFAS
jgi:SAM-dependent methyltransferase